MAARATGWITMNPSVSTTVAGDLATEWRRFATVTIVQTVVVAPRLRMLSDPLPHRIRSRLFRQDRVLVVVAVDVVAVTDVADHPGRQYPAETNSEQLAIAQNWHVGNATSATCTRPPDVLTIYIDSLK
jgi:hypothetical protein